eukprot:812029-Ditylum_brightwellii.AAC.1
MARGDFRSPPGLQAQCCTQHIIGGCKCCHMMMRRVCNFWHADWATLSAHDKRVRSNHVSTTADLSFVEGITPVITGATLPAAVEATGAMPNHHIGN